MTSHGRSLAIRKGTPDCLEELFEMQNRICDLCGHEIQDLCLADLDHSIPVICYARAWDVSIEDASRECNDPSNLRCAHSSCNRKKHDKTREEWFSLGWNNVDAPPFLTEKDLISKKEQLAEYASMGGKVQGPITGRDSVENKKGIFALGYDKGTGGRKGGATNRASGHIQKIGTAAGRKKASVLGCITKRKKDPDYMDKMRAKIDPEKRRQNAQKVGRANAENGHLNKIRTFESCSKGGKRGGRTNVESGHLARLNAAHKVAALTRFLKTVAWG